MGIIRVEVDGHAASAAALLHPVMVNYGHTTTLQVRAGRARGLDLHLDRLDVANRELFGAGLDADLVRHRVRHALADVVDAAVRIAVTWPVGDPAASIMVAVRSPDDPPTGPVGLKSVPYLRPVPHVKHTGTFGQTYYGRRAERDGFHDALLTGPGGVISEAGVSNVGFFDDAGVIWPDAPCLDGVTMRLIDIGLDRPGRRAVVRLADLPSYGGMFVCNSRGLSAVDRVDDTELSVDVELMKTVTEIYDSVAWQRI
jgi:branched-subunit amino acid aminotransferase/4-amino-4-deoxychorismate lyase